MVPRHLRGGRCVYGSMCYIAGVTSPTYLCRIGSSGLENKQRLLHTGAIAGKRMREEAAAKKHIQNRVER